MVKRTGFIATFAIGIVAAAVGCSASGTSSGEGDSNYTAGSSSSSSSGSAANGNGSSSSSGGSNNSSSSSGALASGSSSSSGAISSSSSGGSSGYPATDGGTASCGSKSSQEACITCCLDAHPQGASIYDQAYGNCVCQSPGTCAQQCANTFCSQSGAQVQQGDACDQCLAAQDQGQCGQTAQQACNGNADCQAVDQCVQSSGCLSKQ